MTLLKYSKVGRSEVDDFQTWLLRQHDMPVDYELFSSELELDDLLVDKNLQPVKYSKDQQTFIGKSIVRSMSETGFKAEADDLMYFAKQQPYMVDEIYSYLGYSGEHVYLYKDLCAEVEKADFENNIPLLHAIYDNGHGSIFTKVGKGELTKTSAVNAEYLEDMFKISKNNGDRGLALRFFFTENALSKMLNYENASPEMREFINTEIFKSKDAGKYLDNLKSELYTKGLVTEYFKSNLRHSDDYIYYKDTTKAKSQAEKNANILPIHYKNLKECIKREALNLSERNMKTLTFAYETVGAEVTGYRSWKDIPEDVKRGVLSDGYVEAISKDLENGRVGRLSDESLEALLSHKVNADGFYTKKYYDLLKERKSKKIQEEIRKCDNRKVNEERKEKLRKLAKKIRQEEDEKLVTCSNNDDNNTKRLKRKKNSDVKDPLAEKAKAMKGLTEGEKILAMKRRIILER